MISVKVSHTTIIMADLVVGFCFLGVIGCMVLYLAVSSKNARVRPDN